MREDADTESTRFLPPEPAGPEPDLGGRPAAPPPAAAQPAPPPPPPPHQQQTYGYPPPPPGYVQHPPPGYGQQPPPPGYGYQPPPPGYGQPQQWGYAHGAPAPDNGQAITGFVFSLVALGLLVISFGLSTVFSLGCAVVGIICSRNGKKKVEKGETPKHKGLAQAGFVIGWVALGFSILAIVAWTLVLALGSDDGGFGIDPNETRRVIALALWG